MMTSNNAAAAIINQTIYRNNSTSHFCKLDNETLRLQFPEERNVKAKEILLDALTCESTWIMTAETIAGRWNIPLSTVRKKLSILSRHGYARAEKVVDPKTRKIIMVKWLFFEKPLHTKSAHWKNDEIPSNNKSLEKKSTTHKKRAPAPIIQKEQHKEETTSRLEIPESKPAETEKAPSGAVADLLKIRKAIDPKISMRLNDSTIIEKCSGIDEKQLKWASERAVKPGIRNKAAYFLKMLEVSEMTEPTLKEVPLPVEPVKDDQTWEDRQNRTKKLEIIACYNRSVHKPCTVMTGVGKMTENCLKFCPYVGGRS